METTPKLSRLEKLLCVFTEIRPGEGRTAIYMFANVFLILCGYYLVKPLREGWIAVSDIQGLSKMEVKAYSSFGQSIFLLLIRSLVRAFLRTFAAPKTDRPEHHLLHFESDHLLGSSAKFLSRIPARNGNRLLPVGRHVRCFRGRPILGICR